MMTKRMLSLINKSILIILTILGFSCTADQPDEYGMPLADFKISGSVVDESTLERLQNIQVVMQDPEMIDIHADTCYTDENGVYEVKLNGLPDDKTFIFKCIDLDGAANGAYESLDSTVTFKDPEFVNSDGNWYLGEVKKSITVKLAAKED
jgi:putative lipoprotein (rSAM/lipoprotein system)